MSGKAGASRMMMYAAVQTIFEILTGSSFDKPKNWIESRLKSWS